QTVGMLRDLACQFPSFQQVLIEANGAFADGRRLESGRRLSDHVFPFPAFHTEEQAEQERSLRSTQVAQPAIGAVSLGTVRVLEQFGVYPEATAGHSFGELTALCAAGVLSETALHQLANERGRLMAEVQGEDAGAMLAVHAPLDQVERLLVE